MAEHDVEYYKNMAKVSSKWMGSQATDLLEHYIELENSIQAGVTPYQMAINNTAAAITRHAIECEDDPMELSKGPNTFDASLYIGLAFCKAKEEVIEDIIKAGKK